MSPSTEREVKRTVRPIEVEPVRVFEHVSVAVGRPIKRATISPFPDPDASDLQVRIREPPCELIGGIIANDFVGAVIDASPVRKKALDLIGVGSEGQNAAAERAGGRGGEQGDEQQHKLMNRLLKRAVLVPGLSGRKTRDHRLWNNPAAFSFYKLKGVGVQLGQMVQQLIERDRLVLGP
jgi:hypothetical protein